MGYFNKQKNIEMAPVFVRENCSLHKNQQVYKTLLNKIKKETENYNNYSILHDFYNGFLCE